MLRFAPFFLLSRSSYHTRQGYPVCPSSSGSTKQQLQQGKMDLSAAAAGAAGDDSAAAMTSSSTSDYVADTEAITTTLPSIPERSTYRVTLPPNEVLPARKLETLKLN